jgi:hypothetical protein
VRGEWRYATHDVLEVLGDPAALDDVGAMAEAPAPPVVPAPEPALEDVGETTKGDVSFTAAESKRIILPIVDPLLKI